MPRTKGQISLDFLLAGVVFIILVQAIAVIVSDISESQKKISIENQERLVTREVASMINASALFSDADDFSIKFAIPNIYGPGIETNCKVIVDVTSPSEKIDVVVNQGPTEIRKSIDFVPLAGTSLTPPPGESAITLYCGEVVEIKKP